MILGSGAITRALLAPAEELARMAQQVAAERAQFRPSKETLAVCRRDVRKLGSASMEEGGFRQLRIDGGDICRARGGIPRTPTMDDPATVLEELQKDLEKNGSNDVQNERHIPSPSMNLTLALEKTGGEAESGHSADAGAH